MRANVRRILTAFSNAGDRAYAEGLVWYPNARELAYELAGEYVMGAGVIAALSPQIQWKRNVELARDAFNDHFHGQVGDAIRKAKRIMYMEDPDAVLPHGKKTWHFYHTIVNPATTEHVVIDRHAADIAEGVVRGNGDRKLGTVRYRTLASDYMDVALRLDIPVSQVQAVTWVAHVNRNASDY